MLVVAADLVGAQAIYKVGGAQAVAAMAYGTATIPKVDKIVGPGNQYVATAKRLVFGEVGLYGEIRPVPSGQERLKEAAKHGFKRAIVPKGNAPKESPPGLQVVAVTRLEQALDALFE